MNYPFWLILYAGMWVVVILLHPGFWVLISLLFEKLHDFFVDDIRPRFFPTEFEKRVTAILEQGKQLDALQAEIERQNVLRERPQFQPESGNNISGGRTAA